MNSPESARSGCGLESPQKKQTSKRVPPVSKSNMAKTTSPQVKKLKISILNEDNKLRKRSINGDETTPPRTGATSARKTTYNKRTRDPSLDENYPDLYQIAKKHSPQIPDDDENDDDDDTEQSHHTPKNTNLSISSLLNSFD